MTRALHHLRLRTKARIAASKLNLLDGGENWRNGRLGFPKTIWYHDDITGDLTLYPPSERERRFTMVVLDLDEYERLFRSGALLDPAHTGRQIKPVTDNRKAPGG